MVDAIINADLPTGGVLEPVSLADFFANNWERQPLHVARKSVSPFANLIKLRTIEDLLSTNELYYPSVQLSQSGQTIPISEYTDDNNKIVSARIIDRYRRGSTIVLSQAHKLRSELMGLCREIQSSFMMRCQTNVYLSPAGNQGFNPHFDTHNVFILQVSGKKTFNFYAGGASFPTSADRFNKDLHTVGMKTEEIALGAGDTLYIPRGFVHDAVAHNDEPSVHITVGVYPILMHDLLQEVAQIGVEVEAQMRRAIPQSLWMTSESAAETVQVIENFMKNHLSEKTVTLALSRLRDEFALDTTPNAHRLLDGTQEQPYSLSSEISIDHKMLLNIERADSLVKLRTYGAVVEFNDPYGAAVEWLANQTSSVIQDIPGLVDSQRMALIEKLIFCNVIGVS